MTRRIEKHLRRGIVGVAATLLLVALPCTGMGQGSRAARTGDAEIARADALLRGGHVEAAEAIYYREARRRPRDPAARLALGRYLAARGATRIGVVLIEEARFFGANPSVAALHLAPLYARLGDYKSLALLPSAPLSAAERARAEWLAKNPPAVLGPESVTVVLAAQDDAMPHLGTIEIVIDGEALLAEIDPDVRGLVIDTSRASRPSVRAFVAAPAEVQAGTPGTPAVVARARLGALTLTNLPVSLEPVGRPRRARIGLDLLARLSPSFRPREGRVVLRRSGRVPRQLVGERVPLLVEPQAIWVVWEGQPELLAGEPLRHRLRTVPWTLDARRGEIVVQ